ncbi:MAG: hypothetical protein U0670_23395 [Anaerolineae bacterium]
MEKSEPPVITRRRELPADSEAHRYPPHDEPSARPLKLPDWLERYMTWADATGNQTPLIFHQAVGLWLMATAVGRRLYGGHRGACGFTRTCT